MNRGYSACVRSMQNYGSFPEVDACMAWAKHLNPDYKGKGMSIPSTMGVSKGAMLLHVAKQWTLYSMSAWVGGNAHI